MELIAELEKEKRGVYAGAVGYFGYGGIDGDVEVEGAMDVSCFCAAGAFAVDVADASDQTCIALRTMLVKDGIAYLQAGVSFRRSEVGLLWSADGPIHFRAELYSTRTHSMNGWRRSISWVSQFGPLCEGDSTTTR